MTLAEVVSLFPENAREVPAMLRNAADAIETEAEDDDRTVAVIAVQVTESGAVEVYGWGETDDLHAVGALTAGVRSVLKATELEQ